VNTAFVTLQVSLIAKWPGLAAWNWASVRAKNGGCISLERYLWDGYFSLRAGWVRIGLGLVGINKC